MSYCVKDKFEVYKVHPNTVRSAHIWDGNEMYKSSYFQQSAKNPLALQNSTEDLLKTKSNNLTSRSICLESQLKPPSEKDCIQHDYHHLYRTSYQDMSTKTPKLYNTFFPPKYLGFIPGMKSENPFAATYTRLAKQEIEKFDDKRFGRETNVTYKQWKYNPLSRQTGKFWNSRDKKFTETLQSSLGNHDYTTKLRDSGFSDNLYPSKMNSAWLDKCWNSDMKRTEYRIRYNVKKDFHYKQPTFTTGVWKKNEMNYKFT